MGPCNRPVATHRLSPLWRGRRPYSGTTTAPRTRRLLVRHLCRERSIPPCVDLCAPQHERNDRNRSHTDDGYDQYFAIERGGPLPLTEGCNRRRHDCGLSACVALGPSTRTR